MKAPLYTYKVLITGLLIYGVGDTIAALLAGEFSVVRSLWMAAIGAGLYGLEVPHYFRWVEKKTVELSGAKLVTAKTALAMLYFNPLWVARHLSIIAWLNDQTPDMTIFLVALKSFLSALPFTIIANVVIQNLVSLNFRFMASALFSCAMAIIYPLIAAWF